ncbi:MAG: GIY-YIG nuclease family protein [Chryseobacterium sp.]|nr:GIY-YIG nuclease family protein [Chryseobacterium sp.]
MITVYVLKSLKDNARYTGMAKDLERRLKEHNSGKNRFTKGHIPWEIVYIETHDWKTARKREKFLKSSDGMKFLKNNGLFV